MKKTILCFVIVAFLMPIVTLSQNHSEKYNSLYDRYDFLDSNGNLIGYRKENTLYDRWDYFDKNGNLRGYYKWNDVYDRWDFTEIKTNTTNTTSKTGGRYNVHNYGEPTSSFNTDLAIQALAYKQAQYDNLTSEQKTQLANQRKNQKSRDWVRENSYKWYKLSNKISKRVDKKLNSENRKLKKLDKKTKIDLKSLQDGWYEVVMFHYVESKKSKKVEERYETRYIFVSNNNPVFYLGRENILFNIDNYKKITDDFLYVADISNKHSKAPVSTNFFINKKELLKEKPNYIIGTKLYFYTTNDAGGEIIIDIVDKGKNIMYYLPKLNQFFPSERPNCNTEKGVAAIILPPGEYEYFARTKTKIWRDIITITDTDNCKSINLITN